MGVTITFTPATTAAVELLAQRLRQATSTATSAAEHAVSIVIEGPFRSNTYDNRLEHTAACEPVAVNGPAGNICSRENQSPPAAPTKTPVLLSESWRLVNPAERNAE